MVSKSMIQTFSYSASKAEIVEEATRMAKADGKSFSDFLVSLIEEEVRKKAVGAIDPLNLRTNSNNIHTYVSNKQTDLTQWIQTVHEHKDDMTMLTQMAKLGSAITATANDYIRKNRRPYK